MTPLDRLLTGYLVVLGGVAAVVMPEPRGVVLACLALALCVGAAAAVRNRLPLLHDFAPAPVLGALVNVCGPVVEHANPARWDAALSAADVRWFGPLAFAWTHALGRPAWLTDAASAAYFGYYLLPLAFATALWLHRRAEFHRFAFSIAVVLLASYTAYFLAPAAGPRVPDEVAPSVLGGGALSEALRTFLSAAEHNRVDAFPSGHTATSLVLLGLCWPLFPRLRAPLAAAVAAIIFSTVYLSLHYVVDVFAGAALAALVLTALPLVRAWSGVDPPRPFLRLGYRT